MTKNTSLETLEKQVRALPSVQNEAMAEIIKGMYQGKPLLGENGLLTQLVKDLTQIALQGEMDAHLAENSLEEGGKRRNGIKAKTVRSPAGAFELEVPRDRNSTFEPQLVKKRQTVLSDELDNKILALYGIGTSYDDISSHLQEIYGIEVSAATISAVTDRIIPQIA